MFTGLWRLLKFLCQVLAALRVGDFPKNPNSFVIRHNVHRAFELGLNQNGMRVICKNLDLKILKIASIETSMLTMNLVYFPCM